MADERSQRYFQLVLVVGRAGYATPGYIHWCEGGREGVLDGLDDDTYIIGGLKFSDPENVGEAVKYMHGERVFDARVVKLTEPLPYNDSQHIYAHRDDLLQAAKDVFTGLKDTIRIRKFQIAHEGKEIRFSGGYIRDFEGVWFPAVASYDVTGDKAKLEDVHVFVTREDVISLRSEGFDAVIDELGIDPRTLVTFGDVPDIEVSRVRNGLFDNDDKAIGDVYDILVDNYGEQATNAKLVRDDMRPVSEIMGLSSPLYE